MTSLTSTQTHSTNQTINLAIVNESSTITSLVAEIELMQISKRDLLAK